MSLPSTIINHDVNTHNFHTVLKKMEIYAINYKNFKHLHYFKYYVNKIDNLIFFFIMEENLKFEAFKYKNNELYLITLCL